MSIIKWCINNRLSALWQTLQCLKLGLWTHQRIRRPRRRRQKLFWMLPFVFLVGLNSEDVGLTGYLQRYGKNQWRNTCVQVLLSIFDQKKKRSCFQSLLPMRRIQGRKETPKKFRFFLGHLGCFWNARNWDFGCTLTRLWILN